jgi:hypothetical protein
MKICKQHWQLMRDAIEARGMSSLVAKDGETAMENEVKALEGDAPDFDPLMSMHWHYSNEALRYGGLYLMFVSEEENPDNEGHYCPVCEFEKHSEGFVAVESIGRIADQMREYAIEQKLIPGVQ